MPQATKQNKGKLDQIKQRIVKHYNPERIYLFGSYAWGRPGLDSDFDLFIEKKTNKDRYRRQVEVRRLIQGELPVDVLVYTPQETKERMEMGDFFIKDILEKGKLLYEKN